MAKRLTTAEFIEKAKAVHGDKYDYSKVGYEGTKKKVSITCPIHGEFEQTPNDHFSGCGCRDCGYEVLSHKNAYATSDFIQKARKAHGDVYGYGKVKYKNSGTKVIITCPIHGDFEQIPRNHCSSAGCPSCGREASAILRSLSKEEFSKKANAVHGDKYGYSEVEYENNKKKVSITCPIHGEFEQAPDRHLSGSGCPKCYSYTGRTIVYVVRIESHGEEMLKIGITNQEVSQRFGSRHPDQHATEIATLEFKERRDAETIEAYLHAKHKKHQFTPKVKFGGHTECFNIEALETIKQDFGA